MLEKSQKSHLGSAIFVVKGGSKIKNHHKSKNNFKNICVYQINIVILQRQMK